MKVNNHLRSVGGRSSLSLSSNNLRIQANMKNGECLQLPIVDGEQGWGVVIGTALITMLVNSLLICTGIVGQQVRVLFPSTTFTYLSVVNAVMFALWNFLGPVTNLLLGVFTCKTIALAGGLLLSLGVSLSSQAYNINIFFFTFAILGGIGAGLVLNPGALLLNRYFRRRRVVASSICLVLSTSGQMIIPHLIVTLKNTFKPSGTILLLGGILLHICLAGMLLRPGPESFKGVSDTRHILTLNPTGHGQACLIQIRKHKSHRRRKSSAENMVIINSKKGEIYISANTLRLARIRTYSTGSRTSALPDIPEEQEPLDNEDDGSKIPPPKLVNSDISTNSVISSNNEQIKRSSSFGSHLSQAAKNPVNARMKRPRSRSEVLGQVSSFSSLTSSLPVNNVESTNDLKKIPEAAVCNFKLLKNPLYSLITIGSSLFCVAFPNILFFIAIQAPELGHGDYKMALLLSLYVLCDMAARLLIAWLLPQGFIRPMRIFIITAILALTSLSGLIISRNYLLHCISIGAYGFGCGSCAIVISSILLEYVGFQEFPAALMLLQFIQGLVFAALTPILGAIMDLTGRIQYVYYAIMTLHVLIIIVCLLESVFMPKPTSKRKPVKRQPRSSAVRNS